MFDQSNIQYFFSLFDFLCQIQILIRSFRITTWVIVCGYDSWSENFESCSEDDAVVYNSGLNAFIELI